MSSRFLLSPEKRSKINQRLLEKALKKYRKESDFCRSYKLPPGTLGNWKKKGMINLGFLLQFCLDYDVSLDWLFHGIEPEDLPKERELPANEPETLSKNLDKSNS